MLQNRHKLTSSPTKKHTLTVLLGCASLLSAGETPLPPAAPVAPAAEPTSWCDALQNIGTLFSDKENPYVQEFKVFGRAHYQWAYVDGEAARTGSPGQQDFNYNHDEIRRVYLGASGKFFQNLIISGQANIFEDNTPGGGDDRGFEFQHMWDLYAKYDLKNAFDLDGFDALAVGYGAREVNMSNEWNTSSKNIKTVERSAISNKIWAYDGEFSNPTGAWVEGAQNKINWTFGIFSTTQDDWLAQWDDGQLYYGKFGYDFTETTGADISRFLWTAFYQDVNAGDEVLAGGIEWATSVSMNYGRGPWEMMFEGIYGDNGEQLAGRDGNFYGFVFLPSYWLVADRLEAVARYQYEGSQEDQGVQIYSRYGRRADSKDSLGFATGGHGDSHHSFYGGLNYYLCDNNAKMMAGVQYDDMNSDGDDIYNAWTTFVAFRAFF